MIVYMHRGWWYVSKTRYGPPLTAGKTIPDLILNYRRANHE